MAKNKTKNKKKIDKKKKIETVIENKQNESFVPYYCLIAVLILLVFGLMYGFKILNPNYTTWLFTDSGDIAVNYVGWEAYRAGDWTFPIGLTNATSYPTDISVIYTDSIPLFALFFKLISFMLPKTFQYFGLYGLLCFILQGILSAQIVKKFTKSKFNIVVVSILFTIIPSMIFRMFYHTALASQWLILLALETIFLYNDFKEGKKIYYMWGIISFLVVTIHFYYIVMCGIILLGYMLLDILNTKKVKRSIILLGIYLLVAVASMWIFGGFTNLMENDSFGFGLFSYNLNGLINPQGWSLVFDDLPMIPDQYEGFSYLGLGVMILIVIALILTIIWFIKDKGIFKRYKNLMISLIFISLVSIFVALSPKAYIGEYLLYDLKLPSIITDIWGIFRSTGRFVWPVIHILTLLSVIIILKRLNWKYSVFILLLCTFIQVIDIGLILSNNHDFYAYQYEMSDEYNLYKNETLQRVADNEKIKLLVFVSDDLYDTDKILYSDWAINNNMKTNNFHFARTSFDELLTQNASKYLQELSENEAFIFTSEMECMEYGLYCYELLNNYALGYVNELN